MGKRFIMSSDSDQDLNYFSEIDVEYWYKSGDRFSHLPFNGPGSIDALQRWMRDAEPGDERPMGRDKMICVG